ncbi:MAG: radical SAM protein [Cyanobacteria bacterium P01_D01_bin.105]
MKVLFSNLPWWEEKKRTISRRRWRSGVRAGSRWPFTQMVKSSPDKFVFGDYLPYPFFMGYAVTYAKQKTDAEVVFRDSIALAESYDTYFDHLKTEKYDYIFIESATPSWEHDSQIILQINKHFPDTKLVVTGSISSAKAEEILEDYPVHACIKGEYEKGSVRVINGASGIIEHDLLTLDEMNAAPFPYYDEIYAHRYSDSNPIGQKFPHAHVWSSRGCPFKCIFCVWPATMTGNDPDGSQKRTVRHYSADYMEAFIRELVEKYKFKSIYFDDDTFNLGNNHVLAMCEVMRKVNIPWSAMCRADTIQFDTWKVMKESGCFGVKLGFESGNQWVIDKIVNKHLNLENAAKVVHELKRLGMSVHGTFTYGLPGETASHMSDTRRYIDSLPFDSVQESGTAEIEGTPLHTLREKGSLKNYKEAQMDENYQHAVDGSKKWQTIVSNLQDA